MKFQVYFPDAGNVVYTNRTPDMVLDNIEQVKKMTEIVPQPYIVIPTRDDNNVSLWNISR